MSWTNTEHLLPHSCHEVNNFLPDWQVFRDSFRAVYPCHIRDIRQLPEQRRLHNTFVADFSTNTPLRRNRPMRSNESSGDFTAPPDSDHIIRATSRNKSAAARRGAADRMVQRFHRRADIRPQGDICSPHARRRRRPMAPRPPSAPISNSPAAGNGTGETVTVER